MLHPFKVIKNDGIGKPNKILNALRSLFTNEKEEILNEKYLIKFLNEGDTFDKNLYDRFLYYDNYVVLTCVIENEEGKTDISDIEKYEKHIQKYFYHKKLCANSKEITFFIGIGGMNEHADTIKSFMKDFHNKDIFCISGVSKPYTDITQINKAYEESRYALNYSCMNYLQDSCCISIFHDDIIDIKTRMDICIADTDLIVNTVNTGNIKGLITCLNDIILRNAQKPYFIQKELYSYLMNMFYIIVNSRYLDVEDIMTEDFMLKSTDIKEIFNIKLMDKIIKKCYIGLAAKVTEAKGELIERIVDYIGKNYHRQLSLQVIADEFDMSLTYVSQYFKKATGMNFVDYIRNLRIERAKELLKNKKLSINEVAQKTGFETVNTFIKVFKKLNGITPGEYKNTFLRDYEKSYSIGFSAPVVNSKRSSC